MKNHQTTDSYLLLKSESLIPSMFLHKTVECARLLNVSALRMAVAITAMLAMIVPVGNAFAAVCHGEELPSTVTVQNPNQSFRDVFLNTSTNQYTADTVIAVGQDANTSTVVGGRRSQVLVDPNTLPPAMGSDTGVGPGNLGPGQSGDTVAVVTADANDAYNLGRVQVGTNSKGQIKYETPDGAAFIIGHLLNGDYYGNTLGDHVNFVTLTTYSNKIHTKIESFTKNLFGRFYSNYYDSSKFGNSGNSRKFFAHDYNNTNVTYLPVVAIDVEASTTSIHDAVTANNHEGLQFNSDDTTWYDGIEQALPEEITQTVTVYMRKYTRNGTNAWTATDELKVIPEETWNSIFETKNDGNPDKRQYIVLGDVKTTAGSPIEYNYGPEGPTFSLTVKNEGPFKEFVTP